MIAVGVDTHKERHCAAALDGLGQVLGEFACTATAAGYADLQRWAESHGNPDELVFGIEGAGSWGRRSVPASATRRPHRRRGRTSAALGASPGEV